VGILQKGPHHSQQGIVSQLFGTTKPIFMIMFYFIKNTTDSVFIYTAEYNVLISQLFAMGLRCKHGPFFPFLFPLAFLLLPHNPKEQK
jgi:hypothetical protein